MAFIFASNVYQFFKHYTIMLKQEYRCITVNKQNHIFSSSPENSSHCRQVNWFTFFDPETYQHVLPEGAHDYDYDDYDSMREKIQN